MHLERQYYQGEDEEAKRARLVVGSDLPEGIFTGVSDGNLIEGDALVLDVAADEVRLADNVEDVMESCIEDSEAGDKNEHRVNTTAFIARKVGRALQLHRLDKGRFKERSSSVKPRRSFRESRIFN